MLPAAFDADLAHAHTRWLVEDVGARPFASAAEQRAASGVTERLRAAGWSVQHIGRSPVTCRGAGETLFLAHIDSVPGSPGAVDNAGSVGVLLELARTTAATDLCLGFPVGEEVGFVGSQQMARAWSQVRPTLPSLVVALEFTGQGQPTAVDLTQTWGTPELGWLLTHAPSLNIPYTHRTAGRALAQNRSDHAPFAERGIPAFLLMGRSDLGVFAQYHQASDTTVHPHDLARTADVLEGIARAGPPPRGTGDPALPWLGFLIPGWLTWATIAAGVASGLADIRHWRSSLGSVWRALIAAGAGALAIIAVSALGLTSTEAEQTAAAVMGVPANGWWAAAPWGIGLGWAAWGLARWRLGGSGSAPLLAGTLTGLVALIDPLIALPFGAAAIVSRVHPLLAVAPAFILLRPDPLRELAFHGLLPPMTWGALWLLAWPAFGARRPKR